MKCIMHIVYGSLLRYKYQTTSNTSKTSHDCAGVRLLYYEVKAIIFMTSEAICAVLPGKTVFDGDFSF